MAYATVTGLALAGRAKAKAAAPEIEYEITIEQITSAEFRPSKPTIPKIEDGQIVFHQIFSKLQNTDAYDLKTKTIKKIPTKPHPHSFFPKNDRVRAANRNDGSNIYLRDPLTGKEIIICPHMSHKFSPDISGDKIVWEDERRGCDSDIYMYDLSSKQELRITTDMSAQTNPAIHGDKIVWQDARNYPSRYYDIYMHDLRTKKTVRITQEGAPGKYPDIFENKIVWQEGKGVPHIFMATIREREVDKPSKGAPKLEDFALRESELPKGYTFSDSHVARGLPPRFGLNRNRIKEIYQVNYEDERFFLANAGLYLFEFNNKQQLGESLPFMMNRILYDVPRGCVVDDYPIHKLLKKDRLVAFAWARLKEGCPLVRRIVARLEENGFKEETIPDKAELQRRMDASSQKIDFALSQKLAPLGLKKFANGHSPTWSPDGKDIAYIGDYGVCRMSSDSTKTNSYTVLFRYESPSAYVLYWRPSYSPDGTRIAFLIRSSDGSSYPIGLWMMNSNGENARKVAKNLDVHLCRPSWSPDGERIAVTAYSEDEGVCIYIINPQGDILSKVTGGSDPDWSPDGKSIVFCRYGHSGSPDISGLWLVDLTEDLTKAKETRLTQGYVDEAPKWSPNGEFIAFSRVRFLEGDANRREGNLSLYNVRTKEIKQLVPFEYHCGSMDWSADGKKIVFGAHPDVPELVAENAIFIYDVRKSKGEGAFYISPEERHAK